MLQALSERRYGGLFVAWVSELALVYRRYVLICVCIKEHTQLAAQVMPLVIPLAYYLILPQPEVFAAVPIPSAYEEGEVAAEYTSLPTDEDATTPLPKSSIALTFEDKWDLVKPLLLKYMLPLCKQPVHFLIALANRVLFLVLVYTVCICAKIFTLLTHRVSSSLNIPSTRLEK